MEVKSVGLGRYRAEVPITEAKELTVRLHDRDSDKLKVMQYSASYPEEYRLANKLPEALMKLAGFQAETIRAEIPGNDQHRPIVHWLVFAAMACLIGGMVLRRV